LTDVVLEPDETNLIHGENASGKTSLLEAIFLLGRGKSFRTIVGEGLIRDGDDEAVVNGKVQHGGAERKLGIRLVRGGSKQIRVDGKDEKSAAALAEQLPVQAIDPGVHRLIEEGPGIRRRFADWGVFHVEHGFLDVWRRYHRALKQRNAALKGGRGGEIRAWDDELASTGELVSAARSRYLDAVRPHIEGFSDKLLDTAITLEFRRGWNEDRSLSDALEGNFDRDSRTGATYAGPHRADIAISIASRKAKGRVSRGQQKLLASAMILGQLEHLMSSAGVRSVLLLDDLAAELDGANLERFLNAVGTLDVQLFVTALRGDSLPGMVPGKVFHVEQGKVTTVVQ
jgi:DNA replication and repair protein RecF